MPAASAKSEQEQFGRAQCLAGTSQPFQRRCIAQGFDGLLDIDQIAFELQIRSRSKINGVVNCGGWHKRTNLGLERILVSGYHDI